MRFELLGRATVPPVLGEADARWKEEHSGGQIRCGDDVLSVSAEQMGQMLAGGCVRLTLKEASDLLTRRKGDPVPPFPGTTEKDDDDRWRDRLVPWSAVGLGLTIAALLWYTATRRSR